MPVRSILTGLLALGSLLELELALGRVLVDELDALAELVVAITVLGLFGPKSEHSALTCGIGDLTAS